jgi:hypothetical protein
LSTDDAATTCLYVFESTNAAMWAEDVAMENDIPAEVVPAPPEAEATCGLALRARTDDAQRLEAALEREGVGYRAVTARSEPSGDPPG